MRYDLKKKVLEGSIEEFVEFFKKEEKRKKVSRKVVLKPVKSTESIRCRRISDSGYMPRDMHKNCYNEVKMLIAEKKGKYVFLSDVCRKVYKSWFNNSTTTRVKKLLEKEPRFKVTDRSAYYIFREQV